MTSGVGNNNITRERASTVSNGALRRRTLISFFSKLRRRCARAYEIASDFAINIIHKKRERASTAPSSAAVSNSELSGDSMPLSDSWPSHDTPPIPGFCGRCKAIVIDVEKEGLGTTVLNSGELVLKTPELGRLDLDLELKDTYPGFPHLTTSAARGCGFCGFLKDEILQQASAKLTQMVEAPEDQEIKVEIRRFWYRWEMLWGQINNFLGHGLAELYANCIITNSSGRTSIHGLSFNIMTNSGKLNHHSYSLTN